MNQDQETAGLRYAVHQLIASAVTDPASATRGPLPLPHDPATGLPPDPAADGTWLAAAALAALDAAGYRIVPASVLEELEETASAYAGPFPRCEVIKPDPDGDFYVGWAADTGSPVIAGSREELLAEGCPASRLRRADAYGTSMPAPELGCGWDDEGLGAGQDRWLPREHLAAYARAVLAGRQDDIRALLEAPAGTGQDTEEQP